MWCTQCKTEKAEDHFLRLNRRGWRVEKCSKCAGENMRRYSRRVEKDPDRVRRAAQSD